MAEAGHALYLYCVLPTGERPRLEGLHEVGPPSGVELVAHGPLSAAVSSVPLAEFGADALRRNLEDMAWLERTARAHQDVLDRALGADALVPMRLCTIFSDEAQLRQMLEREQAALLEALDRVRGHLEWSVKVLADLRAVEAAARARSGAGTVEAGAGAGRAYLARKKLERSLREQAGTMVDTAAEEIHARLQAEATAATVLPAQRRELSGRSGEMVLNGAYLVRREQADALRGNPRRAPEASRRARPRARARRPLGAVQLRRRGAAGIVSGERRQLASQREVALVDLVDRALNAGVVISGDITISLADIDLVYLNLRLLLGSVPTLRRELAESLEASPAALLGPPKEGAR